MEVDPRAAEPSPRTVEWARRGFWLLLLASWIVMVAFMWDAMTTIPSAERLQQSRLVEIPGPRRFFAAAAFSAMEMAVVLAALWPWQPAYYASRLAITALGVATWFLITVPPGLSAMDRVHRQWLAFLVLAQVAGLAVLRVHRAARAVLDRMRSPA